MKIFSSAIKIILFVIFTSACHRGMICPAFQSSFILDDSVRLLTFSLFGPDSLPKNFIVDKGKFGVIEPATYPRKYKAIKSIEMVTVFPPGLPTKDSTQITPTGSLQLQISNLGK